MSPADAYGLGGLPFWLVLVALTVIVFCRSHGTYWIARGAGYAVTRRLGTADGSSAARPPGRVRSLWFTVAGRIQAWSTTPTARRSIATLHRVGPIAVTLAYLTVGAQTAVLAAAGLVRMPYLRFLVASIPGCLAWAVIWGTVGLGAWWAAVRLAVESPWGLAAVVLALVATVIVVRRRRRARAAAAAAETDAQPTRPDA